MKERSEEKTEVKFKKQSKKQYILLFFTTLFFLLAVLYAWNKSRHITRHNRTAVESHAHDHGHSH